MGRHFAANAITFLILGLILVLGGIKWAQDAYSGPGPLADATVIEVPSGASLDRISNILRNAGAISNTYVFKTGVHMAELDTQMKFGVYEIPQGASMAQIATLLSEGSGAGTRYLATYGLRLDGVRARLQDQLEDAEIEGTPEEVAARIAELVGANASIELRVAVPEGLTSWQVVEGLNAIPVLSGEIDAVPVEGSLAPNTYSIRSGADRAALLARMAADQERILAAAWEGRAEGLPLDSPEELLILASIIEKETGVAAERERVSSVFINRLNRGMRLQTDPTVIYGITEGRGILGRGLRRSELDRPTPYNTYVIPALPPTPIANPGRLAIEAAANPETTDLLFFVADGTGGHAFARTLEEHNRNVAVWREIEAQRREAE